MGSAWCRERVEQAHNSKSPVDRIITRCSNAINTKTTFPKRNQSKPANDIVFKQIRCSRCTVSEPVPVHSPTARSRQSSQGSEWQDIPLNVPEEDSSAKKTPVPPPRRRKKRKINSLEVLNSQLDMIYESRTKREQGKFEPMLMYGDPLPADRAVKLDDASVESSSSVKSAISDSKRKIRAKKIMESKTKPTKKETFHPLSLPKDNQNNDETKAPQSKMVKNTSSVSLPSYNEFKSHDDSDIFHRRERRNKSGFKRNISTVSLPGEAVLTSLSGVTMNKLEAYLKRCRSFGSLKPQQLLEKLEEITNKQETESSDSWSGLDDWDIGIIEHYDAENSEPPFVPKSRLASKGGSRVLSTGTPSEDLTDFFPSSPPSRQVESPLPDNTLSTSNPTHDWPLSPMQDVPQMLRTPPPTPEGTERDKPTEPVDESHSTLLKILNKYKSTSTIDEESDQLPTPPRRKSREDLTRRRQSYYDQSPVPKSNRLTSRSMSLVTALDDTIPQLNRMNKWKNISVSSSRHSLHQALTDFLGFESQSAAKTDSRPEVNLNSKPFPVIGREVAGDKSEEEETDDDRKTPPPLPSSPPPYPAIQGSTPSKPLVKDKRSDDLLE